MKCWVGKMANWWNGNLVKCQIDEIASSWSHKLAKYQIGAVQVDEMASW